MKMKIYRVVKASDLPSSVKGGVDDLLAMLVGDNFGNIIYDVVIKFDAEAHDDIFEERASQGYEEEYDTAERLFKFMIKHKIDWIELNT